MASGNGTGIQPHNLVRMAELHQHIWAEPRSFNGENEDHHPRGLDGDSQAVYCSPLFRRPRRQEAQGNASAAGPTDPRLDRETLWVISRESDQSLSRVLTALWTRFLFWKHIADYATEQMNHYDDTWNRLEEFNDAVKQKAEPRLLTK